MAYVIKNNLPDGIIKPTGEFTRRNAMKHFIGLVNYLNDNSYWFKVLLRDEKGKPLRGQIKVEVDGFYYYIELYEDKNL